MHDAHGLQNAKRKLDSAFSPILALRDKNHVSCVESEFFLWTIKQRVLVVFL